MSESRFIDDAEGLRRLVGDLEGAPVIGLDTEFLTEHTYYARLCLIQIGTERLAATVDPLACEDLTPLARLLEGPIVMVLHAGAQDLAILQRALGSVPEQVFDTQIAAAFVGYGHSISYSRLVEACCGVTLKRSRAYSDWSRRPLAPDQLEYALDDVRYLLSIHEQLSDKLQRRGRLQWCDDEFTVARDNALHEVEPREQWRRLSGRKAKRPRELSVLRELAAWREEEARRRDKPRQRIMPDRALLEIGRRGPRRVEELDGLRGFHPREAKRSGAAIIAAVARGLDTPPDQMPRTRKPFRLENDPQVSVAAALANTYMNTRARALDLAPQLLANRRDLETIVRLMAENGGDPAALIDAVDGEEPVRLLEGWRRDVVGDDVLRLLAGQIAMRVVVGRGGVDLVVEDQEGPSPGA
ncbi:MAG: ribonuclease D [Acidobacteriota bacterium]